MSGAFTQVLEALPQPVLVFDPQSLRLAYANAHALGELGYTAAELRRLSMPAITPLYPREHYAALLPALARGDSDELAFETRLARAGGAEYPVQARLRLVDRGRTRLCLAFFRNVEVSAGPAAPADARSHVQRLMRARRVMAECSHVLIHASDERAMLQRMCEVVVSSGGYRQAWVGLAQHDERRSIAVGGSAGYETGYIDGRRLTWGSDRGDQGVMGRVIATAVPHIAQNIVKADDAFRRARAQARDYHSSATLPLTVDGDCIGGVGLYAAEADAFDADELALLSELAADIAFGIASLRMRHARELVERALRDSEQKLRAIFDQAAVGITRVDLEGVLTDVNQKFCDMIGCRREELLGRTIQSITHPDDYGTGARHRREIARGGMKPIVGEKRFVRKDGTSFWARRTMSVGQDDTGKPQFIISVVEDLSERKRVERRFELTFNQAAVGIVHTALPPDRHYLLVNRKFCEMVGYSAEELAQMNGLQLTHPEDAGSDGDFERQLLEGRISTYSAERRYIRKDRSVIWTNRTVSLVRDDDGRPEYLIRVVEDITARKELEQRFRATFEQAAVGLMHSSLDRRILMVNQKFCDMIGYTAEELTDKRVTAIHHPEDADADQPLEKKLIAGEIDTFTFEKRYIRRDGSIMWCSRTVSLARDSAGNPLYFIRVIEDITERKEAALRYRTLFESAPVGMMRTALDHTILEANPKLCEIVGYTREELAAMSVQAVVQTQDINEGQAYREKLLAGEIESYQRERELRRKDGSTVWVELVVTLIRDAQGQPLHYVTMMRDVSERKRGEQALRESEEKFRQLADNVPEAFWIVDARTWQLIYLNSAGEAMLGDPLGKLSRDTRNWMRLVHPEDRMRVRAAKRHLLANQGYDEEFRIVREDGSVRWIHDCAFPVRDANGQVYRVAGISADITPRKEAEQKLVQMAHYDALTGLPNRVLFYDRLKQALAQAQRNRWMLAVIFLDLDRFKNVNDTLGHVIGDDLLNQAAARLRGCVRAGDTVGRLGGDEFAIVLSNISGQRDASVVAQKIMAAFVDPFEFGHGEVFVTASLGITLYPDDSTDQDALIRNADTAMYRAKDLGRNSGQFYAPEMNARALEKLSMESSLRRAQERKEFLLYYQPKVSLVTGEITGVEALIRWRHPDLGLISPADFMPVLEETGLILPVGEWVIRAACEQIQAWREAGIPPVPVAVNLSARQFQAKDLAETVREIIERCGVEGRMLELEITESSLVGNSDEAARTLDALGALGIRIAIDDFGTGYSNLNYLKRFPLDALKVDSSFVRDVITSPGDAAITRAIITMAHYLDLNVIGEGVETERQLAFLHANGCDEMQGYYFARPLPADDCAALLASGRRLQHAVVDGELEAPAVLLVDDDEDALVLLRRDLTADGYPVFTATDTREGLKLLDLHNIRVVVSDYSMPGMSGIDFLERVKALHPDTVRIMLTSHADLETVTRAVNQTGIYRFVSKDWGSAHLRADIRQALASSLQAGAMAELARGRQSRPTA